LPTNREKANDDHAIDWSTYVVGDASLNTNNGKKKMYLSERTIDGYREDCLKVKR
jgi:hypothetical protein